MPSKRSWARQGGQTWKAYMIILQRIQNWVKLYPSRIISIIGIWCKNLSQFKRISETLLMLSDNIDKSNLQQTFPQILHYHKILICHQLQRKLFPSQTSAYPHHLKIPFVSMLCKSAISWEKILSSPKYFKSLSLHNAS